MPWIDLGSTIRFDEDKINRDLTRLDWSDIDDLGQCPKIDLILIECIWNGFGLIRTDLVWFELIRKILHGLGSI